jgi:hypothetical protein
MKPEINVGDTLVCAETGKTFIAAVDGCSFNYARNREGQVFSDEGVHVRECRELLDRSRPFYAYISGNGKHITGWKGNVLGTVTKETRGKKLTSIRATDVHGGAWNGRGEGRGMCITLRACV